MSGTTTSLPTPDAAAAQVTRLYDTLHDRAPDADGLAFWTNVLATGINDLEGVATEILATPEGQLRYGVLGVNLGAYDTVNQFYSNALERSGTSEELSFWTNGLASGAVTRGGVAATISESAEHVASPLVYKPVAGDFDLLGGAGAAAAMATQSL